MTYLGRPGYVATAKEIAALPDYYEAMREHGAYRVPIGRYRGQSISGQGPMVVDVIADPLEKTREVWSHVTFKEAA